MANARPEVHFSLTSATGGEPPPPGGFDRFAPKYLVGNTTAGDSAVAYDQDGFVYIPDPGDGTGIAEALAQGDGAGDVWIRPGTYNLTERLVVPVGVRVWGSGTTTNIVSSPNDSCVFQVSGSGAELGWMQLNHFGGAPGVGTALVECPGSGVYVHDIFLGLTSATSGGVLVAGILISGTIGFPNKLHRLLIFLPAGGGDGPADWMAGVRGSANSTQYVDINDLFVMGGNVAVLTVGCQIDMQGLRCSNQSSTGVYSSLGRLVMSGARSVIDITLGTIGAGITLLGSSFEISSVRLINTFGTIVPGVLVAASGGTDAQADLHDMEIGAGFSPAFDIASLDTLIHSNRMTLGGFAVPVALRAASSNCIVQGNVSRGTGGVIPTNAGTGNNIANNVWGT